MWKSKPFRPPLLSKPSTLIENEDGREIIDITDSSRPAKRRRLVHVVEESPTKPLAVSARIVIAAPAFRTPLLPVINPIAAANAAAQSTEGPEGYYLVLW